MSITTLNEKFGIVVCGISAAIIWAGVGAYMAGLHDLGLLVTTAGGVIGGVIGAFQVLVIRNESVNV